MNAYIVGVDGGGSQTSALAWDPDSGRVGEGHGGPGNFRSAGLESACDAIAEAARQALRAIAPNPNDMIGPAALLAGCLSGAGQADDRSIIAHELKNRGLAQSILIDHDARGLLAAAGYVEYETPALAVIAGTGSFVWGRDAAGREERADGLGSLLGDESGAFAIGLEALRAVCRAVEGRGPETTLVAAAYEQYQVQAIGNLVDQLALPAIPRSAIAGFAPKVFATADAMDAVAVAIIETAVARLGQSALAVRARLYPNAPAVAYVLGGAMALAQPLYHDRFEDAVRGRFGNDSVVRPQRPAAIGALRWALKAAGYADRAESVIETVVSPPSTPAAREEKTTRRDDGRAIFAECKDLLTEQRHPDAIDIEEASALEIVTLMNREDGRVAQAVEPELPVIAQTVDRIVEVFEAGGRLFYIGAGTSGRLGALDASECPPTFGVSPQLVQAVIAGGAQTLLRSREGAEDRHEDAERDLAARGFGAGDFLVGLAASRRTPYVVAALEYAHRLGAPTALVTCSPPDERPPSIDFLIAPTPGPEVVMGSTRLKAGTAQKMVLNMLTTAAMIRMGKVYQGMMVDLQLSCDKLNDRAKRVLMALTNLDYDAAARLLAAADGHVKTALVAARSNSDISTARLALRKTNGHVTAAIRSLAP